MAWESIPAWFARTSRCQYEAGRSSIVLYGIAAARGPSILMGDADDSYDFTALGVFLDKLREGYDLVMGNRFAGGILPGAMPPLHRYLGNPVLSAVGRLFFRAPVGDFHCGLRAVNREAYDTIAPTTSGMEFASEMVIKATLAGLRISEVPIKLHPDGRTRPPHLRSWRDGWRHLRFMLLFSPRWLFLVPGLLLLGLGGGVSLWLISGERHIGPATLDIHTLLVAGLACLLGYQLIVFALFTKVFAIIQGFQAMPGYLDRLFRHVSLEGGIVVGLLLTLGGLGTLVFAVLSWRATGFGDLDPRETMRQVIPGAVLLVLGLQTVFSRFFLSKLGIQRRRGDG